MPNLVSDVKVVEDGVIIFVLVRVYLAAVALHLALVDRMSRMHIIGLVVRFTFEDLLSDYYAIPRRVTASDCNLHKSYRNEHPAYAHAVVERRGHLELSAHAAIDRESHNRYEGESACKDHSPTAGCLLVPGKRRVIDLRRKPDEAFAFSPSVLRGLKQRPSTGRTKRRARDDC